ncbi:MAG: DUF2726 domain-containing protein [Burkholderiaceae bacterium]
MSEIWMPALAALVLLMLILAWRSRRRAATAAPEASERLDTIAAWPPEATRLMTRHEIIAFGILSRAFPECIVLAQVPLARFLKVPRRNSYNEWLRRMGSQCADLVLCDMSSLVLAVVHVQPPAGQASERAQQRLARMSRVLGRADIPLGVWTEGALPNVDAARDSLYRAVAPAIAPAPPTPVRTTTTTAAAAVAATPGVGGAMRPALDAPSPFEDDHRDSTQDERIEVREPPLSTWFDDMDSGPGRLPPPAPPKR